MTLTQLAPPYPIFTDKSGSPLDNGYLYFGTANLNPETNPITVYYDSAFTQPAAQPLRTSNGYVMRNGSPAIIYANSQFSVTVRDKNRAMVIYSPVGYGFTPGTTASSTDQLTYNEGGTGAVSRVLTARLQDYVSVNDFGAVGNGIADDTTAINNAIAHCLANNVTLNAEGTYKITSTVNFRYASIDFSNANINVAHAGIGIIIGGNASNPNNPIQNFKSVTRSVGTDSTTTPTVRAIGVKGQNIYIGRVPYFQVYADTSTAVYATDYSSAYSNFYLKYVDTLELTNNAATTGSVVQWINENQFYLTRITTLLVNGTYSHNHNNFWNGSFENSAVITFSTGRSNFVYNTRFENIATVTFDSSASDCVVTTSWTSSNHRYPTTGITVVNNGKMCSVIPVYDMYYPRTSYVGFSYESLKKVGADYNVQGVSNVTINATNLTAVANSLIFTSTFIPVSGAEQSVFYAYISNNTNGIRISVKGYDSSKTLITPAADQVYYDGAGNRQFQQIDAPVNTSTGRTFFVLDSTCAFIKIEVYVGTAALTFDTFNLSIRAIDSNLAASQASWLLTNNNFV